MKVSPEIIKEVEQRLPQIAGALTDPSKKPRDPGPAKPIALEEVQALQEGRFKAEMFVKGKKLGFNKSELHKGKDSEKYKTFQEFRQSLPIHRVKDELCEAVKNHQVTLCVGDTGCGKSTQVPQFLLESEASWESEDGPQILVTQPRRITAMSLGTRVAQERCQSIGDHVGYRVHLDSQSSKNTRLMFCTTGVFRRQALGDPNLDGLTHLVLDELHERDKITDFLLIFIKDLLARRPDLRIILMSATLRVETWRQFFPGCKEVHVEGRVFPVQRMFLDELAPILHEKGYKNDLGPGFAAGGSGALKSGCEKKFKAAVFGSMNSKRTVGAAFELYKNEPLVGDRLEEGLILHDVLQESKGCIFDRPIVHALLKYLDKQEMDQKKKWTTEDPRGTTLVFLPGYEDIDKLKKLLRNDRIFSNRNQYWVLPLHGQIRLDQQREVFRVAPPNVRKIVLATNVAEVSLTIDQVDVVIDLGRAKETAYDLFMGVPTLNLSYVSQASVTQRAGRAGRTRAGVCYHLFSKERFERMDQFRVPEMLRSPVDDVVLHSRLVLTRQQRNNVSVRTFLQNAPDPPKDEAINRATQFLSDIGAFTVTTLPQQDKESKAASAEQLTALGVHLAAMPLPAHLSKMLLWGVLLGVLDDCLKLAAGLQLRSPWVIDTEERENGEDVAFSMRKIKNMLSEGLRSDTVALIGAFDQFDEMRASHGDRSDEIYEFCEQMRLQYKSMMTWSENKRRLRKELQERRLIPTDSNLADRNKGNRSLFLCCLAAGFFPNIAGAQYKKKKMPTNGGKLDAFPHSHSCYRTVENGSTIEWVSYNEITQVENAYSIVDVSPIPPFALATLCGEGNLACKPSGGGMVALSVNEDWIRLRVPQNFELVTMFLRVALKVILRAYCKSPTMADALPASAQSVLDVTCDLLVTTSPLKAQPRSQFQFGKGGHSDSREDVNDFRIPGNGKGKGKGGKNKDKGKGKGKDKGYPREKKGKGKGYISHEISPEKSGTRSSISFGDAPTRRFGDAPPDRFGGAAPTPYHSHEINTPYNSTPSTFRATPMFSSAGKHAPKKKPQDEAKTQKLKQFGKVANAKLKAGNRPQQPPANATSHAFLQPHDVEVFQKKLNNDKQKTKRERGQFLGTAYTPSIPSNASSTSSPTADNSQLQAKFGQPKFGHASIAPDNFRKR